MNKKVLDEVADWICDALMNRDAVKTEKLEKLYNKMFERQWKYYKEWRRFI